VALAQVIDPALIGLRVPASTRDEVIRWAAERLAREGLVHDAEEAAELLIAREEIMSTAIVPGVAVPHARCAGARRLAVAVVQLAEPVRFSESDGHDVRVAFVIVGPPEGTAEHVRVLGEIAKLVQDAGRRQHLCEATDPTELTALLER
jgi:mannitol/fructose-specific phosphotransferase system IIA component (Ntr-type)